MVGRGSAGESGGSQQNPPKDGFRFYARWCDSVRVGYRNDYYDKSMYEYDHTYHIKEEIHIENIEDGTKVIGDIGGQFYSVFDGNYLICYAGGLTAYSTYNLDTFLYRFIISNGNIGTSVFNKNFNRIITSELSISNKKFFRNIFLLGEKPKQQDTVMVVQPAPNDTNQHNHSSKILFCYYDYVTKILNMKDIESSNITLTISDTLGSVKYRQQAIITDDTYFWMYPFFLQEYIL